MFSYYTFGDKIYQYHEMKCLLPLQCTVPKEIKLLMVFPPIAKEFAIVNHSELGKGYVTESKQKGVH